METGSSDVTNLQIWSFGYFGCSTISKFSYGKLVTYVDRVWLNNMQVRKEPQTGNPVQQPDAGQSSQVNDQLRVKFRRSGNDIWSTDNPTTGKAGADQVHDPGNTGTASNVVGNVSSFLSGICASFRSDNIVVESVQQLKKSSQNY